MKHNMSFVRCDSYCRFQEYHPLFMGKEFIGPAVEHFQEITAQFPEVKYVMDQ